MAISNINPGVYSVSSTTVQPLAIINTTTTIPANSSAFFDMKQVLAATKLIKGGASATTINFHISGVEIA